ncbi:MAG TPA: hypothetical protein DCP28_30415 [Cytophagales bacterium]|nr:hypothetical protein [Cytophagales bacterium]
MAYGEENRHTTKAMSCTVDRADFIETKKAKMTFRNPNIELPKECRTIQKDDFLHLGSTYIHWRSAVPSLRRKAFQTPLAYPPQKTNTEAEKA